MLLAYCLLCIGAVDGAWADAAQTEAVQAGAAALSDSPKILRVKVDDAEASPAAIVSGELDSQFEMLPPGPASGRLPSGNFWLKFEADVATSGTLVADLPAAGLPVLVVHSSRQLQPQLFVARDGTARELPVLAKLPGVLALRDSFFEIPEEVRAGRSLYAHIVINGAQPQSLSFSSARLDGVLAQGAERARMIAFAVGALTAVSLAALLIWFVLKDRLFILYATLFLLQALYIAYLSGQGFDWPLLAFALPFASFAWNVPAALSGAVACLFTREIADLKGSSPRVYAIFGWSSLGFVLLGCANLAKFAGYGPLVNALGNLMFLGIAIFTAVVCFRSWRRGNRPAGWFLIAWALLEGSIIAAAAMFLLTSRVPELLFFEGLPLSMVAASVLIALGVADRLRAQRVALTDAERRAQTDPLTGVLNRNSLIERLHAACQRAQTRGLPISLLFIDLDHFKQINDSFGHQAGDACLRAIIAPIHAELRQSDVIGRYGGEEFVVILSSADAAVSVLIAQRILERVAEVRVDGFGLPIRLTCSIGVASSDTLGVWDEHLVARADAAVYAAKRAGRNQLFVAQPSAA